jgi:hypothetical protein
LFVESVFMLFTSSPPVREVIKSTKKRTNLRRYHHERT